MTKKHTRGETHGCIVCGKPHQLYVVYNEHGKFIDAKVMSPDAKLVSHGMRALVACDRHEADAIKRAVDRVYGPQTADHD